MFILNPGEQYYFPATFQTKPIKFDQTWLLTVTRFMVAFEKVVFSCFHSSPQSTNAAPCTTEASDSVLFSLKVSSLPVLIFKWQLGS